MRFTERQNNTREQVVDYLRSALEVVDELELHDELRVPAFLKACDLFANKQITIEQVAPMLGNPAAFRGH